MAERRMFTKKITNSDAFIDMPLSTQALYFHLNMEADDDGFNSSPKKIQRMIGASDDDLKILFAKNFVIPFESGVVVIKHWKLHNYIQNDRYKETVYLEEKKLLETKENKVYTIMDTNCIQDGYTGKVRLEIGKSKDSIEENNNIVIPNGNDSVNKTQLEEEFETIWREYPRKQGKANALKTYIKARKKGTTYEEVLIGLENYVKYITIGKIESQYIKQGSTWFNQECWNDDYTIKEKKPNYKSVREEVVPEWINKDIKAERVTEEERKELEDLLKKFDNP